LPLTDPDQVEPDALPDVRVPTVSIPADLPALGMPRLIAEWERISSVLRGGAYLGTAYDDLGWEIGQRGVEGASFLLPKLESDDANQVAAAVGYLPWTGIDPAECARLIRPFLTHREARVRSYAIDSLAWVRDGSSIEVVEALLEDPDWLVQNAALGFVCRLRPEVGVPEAVSRVRSLHPKIREHAIDVLDELEDAQLSDECWDLILPAIADGDWGVRSAARGYLSSRLPRVIPARTNLHASPVSWIRAAHAAFLAGTNEEESLETYWRDPDPMVRLNLIEALSARPRDDLRAVFYQDRERLTAMDSDRDARVRMAWRELIDAM
jgi:HEAT repeat protein